MRKIKVIMVLIGVLLVIGAGCEKKDGGEIIEDFIGTTGLSLSFVDGMPPPNVWKDMDFNVWVDVRNEGLSDVSKGAVCFSSMSSNIFTKADGCMELGKIIGRENFPGGEIKTYMWDGYRLTKSYRRDANYPLSAKVCYVYETLASPEVCVRPIGPGKEARCEAGEIVVNKAGIGGTSKFKIFSKTGGGIGGSGQGAPVAVDSVYEEIIPRGEQNELLFVINVKNVGGGEVIDMGEITTEDCKFGRGDKDKVKIEVELLGYKKGSCSNNGVVRLRSGEGQVICRGIMVPNDESFPLPLNIKLDYGYLSTVNGGFNIKRDIDLDYSEGENLEVEK